ncbi:MOSC and FAD-binding oxidoreductase domain-containing protein [Paraburkholderia caribensis]|uniref:nitric oxide dioxygenase n=1 Tax=Paraburkholderia caribensis TaxID=75105 RepID=A0A9Q6WMV6_9BURK|nr:MOSC and FAD-binding oxidoreductase domain-containing protein [Paraburkholderia caribensis]MCO4877247.1 MOSC domain-containing protein [Paraburkholderia caribensis]PTB28964.1 sulfurase [Paraburkholderia caribensis]QLB64397.1 sulfurase [Paraburkholderia caribensis]
MARLLSVNVGLPRDIEWNGRTVHTGSWKLPVQGRCVARRLGLDGDGQGDLGGHGGEQRAVLAYQIDSYRHWQAFLHRKEFGFGQFSENFTIDGLPDREVCIGDVYKIGHAIFEVTQPRVTCYRLGIRMGEPRMAALLTSSGRPGFYLRVLQEGDVGAGDEIVKLRGAKEQMTVEEINALLYSPAHPRDRLERAVCIDALSPGWRASFNTLLGAIDSGATSGNAGLAPAATSNAATPGFRQLGVAAIQRESVDVLSFVFEATDGLPLQQARPGQYVVLRLRQDAKDPAFFRSYSLSGAQSTGRYRISVKLEPNGAAGTYLANRVRVGDTLDVSAPRGDFVLKEGIGPVVLLSAGIGVTPVLSMLHALSVAGSRRQVLWIHAARDGEHHPFGAESRRLLNMLEHARGHVCYSAPAASDRMGDDFDDTGRVSQTALEKIGLPVDADVYLCGPASFMHDMKGTLERMGVPGSRLHLERFGGVESFNPGVTGTSVRAPHLPPSEVAEGPLVSFARSGIAAHWNALAYPSILELAEACDVPVRWSCRSGVCHNCESGLVSGTVAYEPEPLDKPADGNVLICCSRPAGDIVVDL